MGINSRLATLYRKHYGIHWKWEIYGGGVVNEAKYVSANPRVLHLGKEGNDPNKSGKHYNLPDVVKGMIGCHFRCTGKGNTTTWFHAALWTHWLVNDFPKFNYSRNDPALIESAARVAGINLKKVSGAGTAIEREIRLAAFDPGNPWQDEIKIIDPEIVVCWNNFELVTTSWMQSRPTQANNRTLSNSVKGRYLARRFRWELTELNRHPVLFVEMPHAAFRGGEPGMKNTWDALRKIVSGTRWW